jgi:hypothetical protein
MNAENSQPLSEPSLRFSRTTAFNCPAVQARWKCKPSWRAYGTGEKWIQMFLTANGSLDIQAQEIAHNGPDKRDTIKEVYITLPVEVVAELKRILEMNWPEAKQIL